MGLNLNFVYTSKVLLNIYSWINKKSMLVNKMYPRVAQRPLCSTCYNIYRRYPNPFSWVWMYKDIFYFLFKYINQMMLQGLLIYAKYNLIP